jgi:hypothetical protein
MNSNPNIESYFIQYRNAPEAIEGNTLWLSGQESFSGIIFKTLNAMEKLVRPEHDFIIRTNLSSVWNFSALMKFLESMPPTGIYAGPKNEFYMCNYVSGTGIILSRDVCATLLQNKHLAATPRDIDDVDIGMAMKILNVPIYPTKRVDIGDDQPYEFNNDAFHYRLKSFDFSKRHEEPARMMSLIAKFQ